MTAAVVGIPQASGQLTLGVTANAVGLRYCSPSCRSLEMLALRRMTPTAFGTLMALEPALAVLLGLTIGRDDRRPRHRSAQLERGLDFGENHILPTNLAAGGGRSWARAG